MNRPIHFGPGYGPIFRSVNPAQINVECLPVYPSCNDVECVENAICSMEEGGPMCVCEDGYTMYEDGKLGCRKLQPITRGITNPGLACQFFWTL